MATRKSFRRPERRKTEFIQGGGSDLAALSFGLASSKRNTTVTIASLPMASCDLVGGPVARPKGREP
jgi:hypothetical protein